MLEGVQAGYELAGVLFEPRSLMVFDVREELHHESRRFFGTHMPCTLLYDYQVRIDPGR